MKRQDFKTFKKKALRKKGVQKEYKALETEYMFRKELVRLREKAGLTQSDIAELMGTKKTSISRLESVNAKHSPRLAAIKSYAAAAGYDLHIQFKPSEGPHRQ